MNFEDTGVMSQALLLHNTLMWMDYHLEGRLDTVHEFVDRSAIHFMEQFLIGLNLSSHLAQTSVG